MRRGRAARPGAQLACLLPVALLGLIGLPAAAVAASADAPCGEDLDARHRLEAVSPRHRLVFVPQPAPLVSGRHFALDIVVCPLGGASWPAVLRVDADMPAHRHGMNYRPTVRKLADGRYRADGLLLHMPGRWRFTFELSADGRLDRLQHERDVE